MYHDPSDPNGASSDFFWLSTDRSASTESIKQKTWTKRLDEKYALFAHVIEGNDILEQLRPGDLLVETKIIEGVWELIQPDPFDETKMVL